MQYQRPGRIGGLADRPTRAGVLLPRTTSRRTGRPLRIASFDVEPAEAATSADRVVLLRFEWRTSRNEIQPVLLALPELLD